MEEELCEEVDFGTLIGSGLIFQHIPVDMDLDHGIFFLERMPDFIPKILVFQAHALINGPFHIAGIRGFYRHERIP